MILHFIYDAWICREQGWPPTGQISHGEMPSLTSFIQDHARYRVFTLKAHGIQGKEFDSLTLPGLQDLCKSMLESWMLQDVMAIAIGDIQVEGCMPASLAAMCVQIAWASKSSYSGLLMVVSPSSYKPSTSMRHDWTFASQTPKRITRRRQLCAKRYAALAQLSEASLVHDHDS